MKKRDRQLIELSRRLDALGLSLTDQEALRRIEMTLHRWAEEECGNSNDYGTSWCITRDDETGKPYREVHPAQGKSYRKAIADKETGALNRLKTIMAKYPALWYYHQGDPRGCALYVGRNSDLPVPTGPREINAHYTRGVAVCL